eukprot:794327-Amphidinium_carterae.4
MFDEALGHGVSARCPHVQVAQAGLVLHQCHGQGSTRAEGNDLPGKSRHLFCGGQQASQEGGPCCRSATVHGQAAQTYYGAATQYLNSKFYGVEALGALHRWST